MKNIFLLFFLFLSISVFAASPSFQQLTNEPGVSGLIATTSKFATNAATATNGPLSTPLVEAANIPAWTGSNYLFFSQWGSVNNSGLSPYYPLDSFLTAEAKATNGVNLIYQMPGDFREANGNYVNLPDNIDWYSAPGSRLIMTNQVINSLTGGMFVPGNNSHVWNLNLYNPDEGNSEICIGIDNNNVTANTDGKTNWWFYNCRILTFGTAAHWESTASVKWNQGTFVNCSFEANRACVVVKVPNLSVLFDSCWFYLHLITNNAVANTKPLAVFDLEASIARSNSYPVMVKNSYAIYTDQGSTNPAYFIWGGGQGLTKPVTTNPQFYATTTILNPSLTNINSYDIDGTSNRIFQLTASVNRIDGLRPTVTNENATATCLIFNMSTWPTNSPTASVTNVLKSDGTVTFWADDKGLF